LTIKRLNLTAFFIVLTLSIGVVVPYSAEISYAQNNALSQSGNVEHLIEQLQSFIQNNQVMSSVLCQDQDNSELSDQICNSEVGVGDPGDQIVRFNVEVVKGIDKGPIAIAGVQITGPIFIHIQDKASDTFEAEIMPRAPLGVAIISVNHEPISATVSHLDCENYSPDIVSCINDFHPDSPDVYDIKVSQGS
jgi:hypothetical protein